MANIEILSKKETGHRINTRESMEIIWRRLAADDPEWYDTSFLLKDNEVAWRGDDGHPYVVDRDKTDLRIKLANGQYALGHDLRLMLVQDYLMAHGVLNKGGARRINKGVFLPALLEKYLASEQAERDALPARTAELKNFGKYQHRMQLSGSANQLNATNTPTWDLIRHAMVWALNHHHQNRLNFDIDLVFGEHRYVGRDAILEFGKMLDAGSGQLPKTNLIYVAKSAGMRDRCFNRVLEEIARPDNANAGALLVNVVCNGLWRDGAAFAQKLTVKLKAQFGMDDRMDVLRIPLTGYAQTKDQNPEAQHTLSYDELVKRLADEFGIAGAPDPKSTTFYDLIPTIRKIRQEMARSPRIFIFEGYYEPDHPEQGEDSVGTEILRIARDDHFKGLLLRLMEPPMMDHGEDLAVDPSMFGKNRFVVISSRRLSYFDSESAPRGLSMETVEIPKPEMEELRTIFNVSKLIYWEELTKEVDRRRSKLHHVRYEPVFDLLDKFLILKFGPQPKDTDPAELGPAIEKAICDFPGGQSPDPNMCLDALMRAYLAELRKFDPATYQLHLLLSIVPCGLRNITLRRIARRYLAVQAPRLDDDPFASVMQASEQGGMWEEKRGYVLVTDQQSDIFHGFDHAPPIFETAVLASDGDWENPGEYGYDFADPIMKESVHRLVSGSDPLVGKQAQQLAHRMLAEESLSQQTLAFRFKGIEYTPSFRSFRRLVSTIYHSLCAVPLTWDGNVLTGIDKRSESSIVCPFFSGSRNQLEYFIWVYVFLYRTVIERPPYWEFSRRFALDRLKLDILEAFDNPWKIPGHPEFYSSDGARGSLISAVFGGHKDEVVIDYFVNKSHALTALSQVESSERLISQFRELDPGQDANDRFFELRHLKDRLNVELLTDDPVIEREWGRLWSALEVPSKGHIALQRDLSNLSNLRHELDAEPTGGKAEHDAIWLKAEDALIANYNSMIASPNLRPHAGEVSVVHATERVREDVEDLIGTCTETYFDIFNEGAGLSLYSRLPSLREAAVRVFDLIGYGDPRQVSEFCHAVYRLSDMTAAEADLWRSKPRLEELNISDTSVIGRVEELQSQLGTPTATAPSGGAYHHFCRSLAMYKMAEQLRMEVFRRDPLGNHFFHSGRAARACIRTCLVLEREARKRRIVNSGMTGPIAPEMRLGLFSREARRVNDRVTKHLFRFPRERASLQIIESSTHRMLSEPFAAAGDDLAVENKFHLRALRMSHRFLLGAEGIITGLSRRNRIRMHFFLERTKWHVAMASASVNDPENASKFLLSAREDAQRLQRLAEASELPNWIVLAAMAAKRVDGLSTT